MNPDELRNRYLRERVLTASPAQRVVMLYDRLSLDLARAASAAPATDDVDHALQVLAELRASLDESAGGPAENLAAIYGYLLRELIAVRGGDTGRLPGVARIIETLRAAWSQIAAQPQPAAATSAARVVARSTPVTAGAWVG